MINYNFIAVEGNIGVGKTSLARLLAKEMKSNLILEKFNQNHFLPLFYQNPKRYSLPLEVSFLIERYQQLLEFHFSDKKIVISDYMFEKSNLFSKNTLEKVDYRVFQKLFIVLEKTSPKPDLIIYLENNLANIKKNIAKRDRDFEKNISNEYLSKIDKSYRGFFKKNKSHSIVQINVEKIDFVKKRMDFLKIFNLLNNEYPYGKTTIQL